MKFGTYLMLLDVPKYMNPRPVHRDTLSRCVVYGHATSLTLFCKPRVERRQHGETVHSAKRGRATFCLKECFGVLCKLFTDLPRSKMLIVGVRERHRQDSVMGQW